ncbi:GntR family transcriptional regulator [Chelatococcus sp. SYSU_G07232]|uniref:GntR family transcriptional regulator n=1 Tax=Chelatococcus albus TaxID=3047466 RepID=A0ABT7AK62_9HYPH|nr:GntR family transcriptional regulator [Chelatococcus sp. SYSU_G07232]MDJ1159204.1 GntR family transcriptional regulator [Chelatococcus sp. SYSU_G07232]
MNYEQPRSGEPAHSSPLSAAGAPTRESLHDEVLARLRDFIVEGHLKPGDRVPERQLCETFGISRTPLREALKVLASEGLIDLLPNRGARVRKFTEKDVRDSFELLASLEAAAGRLACARISEAEVAEIERLHYDMYGHYMRRELPEYLKLNQAIHAAIVAASNNQALQAAHRSLTARMRQFRYSASTIKRDRWGQAMREHEQMIDALRRRDGRELGDILFEHLLNKLQAAYEAMRAQEAAEVPEVT